MTKQRLDVELTARGLAESRQKAQAAIMSGQVFVGGARVDKPGTAVAEDAQIEVRGGLAYVSRGGLKLEKAMAAFPIDLSGAVCADIGASTGGFTDCMLQNGAEKVYAVDVGYGQLAWKLRSDERVVCLERTNARYLTHEQVELFQSDFKVVADYFVQKRESGDYIPSSQDLTHVQETLQLLSIMTNDNRFEEAYNTNTDGQKGGPRNMCDVLDKVESRGIEKGIVKGESRGENKMALLVKKLLDQNRIDDVKRASEDEKSRAELVKELGIN